MAAITAAASSSSPVKPKIFAPRGKFPAGSGD